MFKLSTGRWRLATVLFVVLTLGAMMASAQVINAGGNVDWRHIGNTVIDRALAGAASGPVKRVWYGANGMLYAETAGGRVYQTTELESWQASSATAPKVGAGAIVPKLPEAGAQTRVLDGEPGRVYAFGDFVYRSEDGGAHWENMSGFRGASLIGGVADLAIAPGNADEIVTAGAAGVFRSVDGGRSWSGLNDGLPNLPVSRLLNLPEGDQGVRIALGNDTAAEWPPGNKQAWVAAASDDLLVETQLRRALSMRRGGVVTAITVAGTFIYTGMQNGEIQVSGDRGVSWQTFSPGSGEATGPVERFWVDSQDPRVAMAALGQTPDDPMGGALRAQAPVHVLHTVNAGAFWDNFTANLPDAAAAAHAVAADRASGALYAATDRGVFMAYGDLSALGAVESWTALPGLPEAAAMDVKLDRQANQLWAAIDGYGVYSTLAPHRLRDPSVVSAGDLVGRAAAPGSVMTILGAQVDAVRAGGVAAPVLAATASESQIQIPFEARGNRVALSGSFAGNRVSLPSLPLAVSAPVIFVARDGSPMLLDADKGVMLDAMTPAHSGTRIQILATGLGQVTPEWPTGVAAPLQYAPRVAGDVRVYLDRAPVEVTRAELAPGYVGFYLVEISIPKISDYGPAELYLDVDGAASNRVRVYIEP
jgi:uncharacterized protein (TIGR03437 family)